MRMQGAIGGLLLAAWLTFATALPGYGAAVASAIWEQVPAYPWATRPLPSWEAPRLAIAQTQDAPLKVVSFYATKLPQLGWSGRENTVAEAAAAVAAGAPAWLSFTHPRQGRLDVQIHAGPHPKTGNMVTLIFYETSRTRN